jgi:hypothetical protein
MRDKGTVTARAHTNQIPKDLIRNMPGKFLIHHSLCNSISLRILREISRHCFVSRAQTRTAVIRIEKKDQAQKQA